jgi:rubrerythrin
MNFVNSKKALQEIKEMKGENKEKILKGLEIAKEIEESSMEFYSKEANKTSEGLKIFFEFMVKEEEGHLTKINELREMVNTNEFNKIEFPEHVVPKPEDIKAGKEELLALLYALHREKKAREFYKNLSEMSENEVSAFFKELAEFENEHVELLEEYVDATHNAEELIMG